MRPVFLHILAVLLLLAARASAETINVAADISLKEAMIDLGAAYQNATDEEVVFTFGAGGALVKQVNADGPFDAFIGGANSEVDALERTKLIVAGSRRVIAGNALVVIVPAKSTLKIKAFADLTEVQLIAIADAKISAAGQYAMQVIEHLNLEAALKPKLVVGQNVRQVLDDVVRGAVDAGIVYRTDAEQAGLRVRNLLEVPAEAHDPVLYPAVVLSSSKKQAATLRFLTFVKSAQGRQILSKRHGFVLVPPTTRPTTQPTTRPGD